MTPPRAQPDARSVNIVPLLNDTDILRSLSAWLGDHSFEIDAAALGDCTDLCRDSNATLL